jgi:mono/diheme cytochrome c family protein
LTGIRKTPRRSSQAGQVDSVPARKTSRTWIGLCALLCFCPLSGADTGRFSDEDVHRGLYLAGAGNCITCHTVPNGIPYAGGRAMRLPDRKGTIYSPNITPDPETGIGNYSFEDFDRAVRQGVTPNGGHLYPAMPYPSFARINQADMRALYAYFMQGVSPVKQANRPDEVVWPQSMRWPLAIWNNLFVQREPFRANPRKSAQWNRGAYLVEGLGHCGACHTPRGWFSQEQASSALGNDAGRFLSGAPIDNWFARNLRGDERGGLGRWSEKDIVELLKNGRTPGFAVVGSMEEVVKHSTRHLSTEDLQAIAVYLKSLPPAFQAVDDVQASRETLSLVVAKRLGEALYQQYCSSCHQADGKGKVDTFPALALNPSVESRNPLNTIRMMLYGGHSYRTRSSPMALALPVLGGELGDQQIAAIATYIRNSWGNRAPMVSVDEVKRVRAALTQ